MGLPSEGGRQRDHALLLFLLALVVIASPLTAWWLALDGPWFLPYVIWLLVIAATAWLHYWHRHDL